jgi:molybdopterin/thiamine biosynthesis adenylyltransferase
MTVDSSAARGVTARLQRGRVLIVGVGGLGAPAALWLARAGVGTLGLLDGDAVESSNLHRQIIYRVSDIGRRKVDAAAERLAAVAPAVRILAIDGRCEPPGAVDLFRQYDFVIDGTDHVASKYVVNDAAVLAGVPYSHAGIVGLQGQTFTVVPKRSACLRCLFPAAPAADEVPTCQEAGVLGALAGSIGLIQAAEALKHLLEHGTSLADRLLTYDAGRGRWREVSLRRSPDCPLCGDRPVIRRVRLEADEGGPDFRWT